jgi:hypothetical protein
LGKQIAIVSSINLISLTRLESNRQTNANRNGLKAVSEAGLCGGDAKIVSLKGFVEVKVFRVRDTDGTAEY